MKRLVRFEQSSGHPLTVNPEFVAAVYVGEINDRERTYIVCAGMSPFELAGSHDDVVASIDKALSEAIDG